MSRSFTANSSFGLLPLLGLALACGNEASTPERVNPAQSSSPADAKKGATVTAVLAEDAMAADEANTQLLTWIHDDLPRARGRATSLKRPILVDMWAPWCHTCLSMQQNVLRDPALAPVADRFVWLAADTDKDVNAELVKALPMSMWPTFFVVDPADMRVHARFAGAASAEQFLAFADDGLQSFGASQGGETSQGGGRASSERLREALRLEGEAKYLEAEVQVAQALIAAPPGWARRADTWVERVRLLNKGKAWAPCVEQAQAGLAQVEEAASASVTDFSYYARTCAMGLADGAALPPKSRALLTKLDAALTRLDARSDAKLSIDDRSDMLANWRELALAFEGEDSTRARAIAKRQRDLLKAAWHAAADPETTMTYMWPRAEVHVFLGEGEAIVTDYQAMVSALPESYEPPYRLAWLLLQLERAEEARPHAQAAVKRLYGPRKARALAMLADIEAAAGDPLAQREARAQIVALWESLPASEQQAAKLKAARADLRSIDRAFGTGH